MKVIHLHGSQDRGKAKEYKGQDHEALEVFFFTRGDQFSDRLDNIAENLPKTMELENFIAVPTEIPDALPAFVENPSTHGVPSPSPLSATLSRTPMAADLNSTPLSHKSKEEVLSVEGER